MTDLLHIGSIEGRNKGEALLMDIANALSSGKLPDKALSDQFVAAVRSMAKEPDRSLRADMFINGIGLANSAHCPPVEAYSERDKVQKSIALTYWLRRFEGARKTKAAQLAAEEFQRSGKFEEGRLSTKTVGRYVEKHIRVSVSSMSVMGFMLPYVSPSAEWTASVKAEMKQKLDKNT